MKKRSRFVPQDNYCWQTGTYKDNTTASSRKNPEVHSIMCLTDPGCVASGFAVLAPPATSGANYTIKYQLGTAGTTLALNAARAAQNATGLSRGFQMSFTGVDDGSGTLQCITATPTQSPSPPRPPPPVSGAVCWACPSQMMKTQVAMFSFLILAMATAATAPV